MRNKPAVLFAVILVGIFAMVGADTGAGLNIIPRQDWGARKPDISIVETQPMGKIRYVSVHQTETPLPDSVGEERRLRGIQYYHHSSPDGPGWGDIAYHYLIGPSGTIYEGRSEKYAASSGTVYLTEKQWQEASQSAEGATTAQKPEGVEKPGASEGHLTISLIGTFHENLPSEEAREAVTSLVAQKLAEHGLSMDQVFFHKEIACWTDCPGQALYDWFRGPSRKRGAKGPGLKIVAKKLKQLK